MYGILCQFYYHLKFIKIFLIQKLLTGGGPVYEHVQTGPLKLKKVPGVYGVFNNLDKKKTIYRIQFRPLWEINKPYERKQGATVSDQPTNIRLQRSLAKYGLHNFNFVIYFFHKDPDILLTYKETEVIKSFPFEELYNFKKEAISMSGYKHTAEAIAKNEVKICK